MRVIDLRQPGWGPLRDSGALIYCGRPFRGWPGSPLANPFTPGLHGKEAIRFYREWLKARITEDWPPVMTALRTIDKESVLGCWCVDLEGADKIITMPMQCHCQAIWHAWYSLFIGGPLL